MKKIVFIIFMMCLTIDVQAQNVKNVSKTGTTAAPFLTIGVSSRSEALGGAFVAIADDASALFWNPAGIARLNRFEIIATHSNWIADMDFNYAGVIIPIGPRGTVGLSFTSLSSGDMRVRTVDQPGGTGEYFSGSDIAIQLTTAINLTDRFSIGFSGKYINQRIWKESASAFALDIGTLFNTGFRGMRIGTSLYNFGTDMKMSGNDLLVYHDIDKTKIGNNDRVPANLSTEAWPLPLNFQFGVAMEIIEDNNTRITIASDAIHASDNTESINFGIEYAFQELVFLRGGIRNQFIRDGEEGFTFGAGLSKRFVGNIRFNIDYSFSDFGRLDYIQRFTMGFAF